MKPNQLRALIAISKGEGLAAAAEHLHISVPAVIKTIAALENEVGMSLLDRSGYRTFLNDYGKRLVEHGKLIVSEIDEAKRDLNLMKSLNDNLVRVNASPAVLPVLLPEAIHRLRSELPNASVSFEGHLVGHAQQKLDDLLAGDYDLLINVLDDDSDLSNFRYQALANMQLKLMASPGHPATEFRKPKLNTLREFPWLIPAGRGGLPHMVMQRMFSDSSTRMPDQLICLPTREMVFELMNKGEYLAIVPYHKKMIERDLDSLELIECSEIQHGWQLHILQRKSSVESKAVRAFIRILQDIVREG